MENSVSLPKYRRMETQFGKQVSVRLTESATNALPILCEATHSSTVASLFRLLIPFENQLIKDGLRNPSDYIPTDKRKVKIQNFSVSEKEYRILESIKEFYNAPTMTGVINHLLMSAIKTMSEKAVR